METKFYKVFEIDSCFEDYAANNDLVGAESIQDIFDHWQDIFPDIKENVIREDWMSEEDWEELREYGKYKEGEIKITPFFTEEQMNEFKESLDTDNRWSRIKEIPNLFTDKPYTILAGYGYME